MKEQVILTIPLNEFRLLIADIVNACLRDHVMDVKILDKKKVENETPKPIRSFDGVMKHHDLRDAGISVRLFNILWLILAVEPKTHKATVQSIASLSRSEFLSRKGVGKATVRELEELLESAGIEMLP